MESRELFPLGRGAATATLDLGGEPPSGMRPFGMRQAIATVPATGDDTDGLVYNHDTQTLALTDSTGNPDHDRLLITMKTKTSRATDRDGSKPTTPKDLQTIDD